MATALFLALFPVQYFAPDYCTGIDVAQTARVLTLSQSMALKCLAFLLFIQKVPVSNLGLETGKHVLGFFFSYPQSLQVKFRHFL
jgi:hypothetical protein